MKYTTLDDRTVTVVYAGSITMASELSDDYTMHVAIDNPTDRILLVGSPHEVIALIDSLVTELGKMTDKMVVDLHKLLGP